MTRLIRFLLPAFLLQALALAEAPLFRDFVGLAGHTVQFKPDLYRPVCRVVRDYHPVEWDLSGDTAKLPDWPFARNRVSWEQVYGSWHQAGLRITACLMIDELGKEWKNLEEDAFAYGRSFAENFGPGGKWPFVEWVEIGNEPGLYDDATFQRLFKAMARGVREGNPRLKIATCNVEAGPSDRYWKSADLFKESGDLYDVLRIHRYAIADQWPTWRRTFPEDPSVPYLSSIQALLDWRKTHAPGKPVWVSEFGWDSSTQKPDPNGEWAKWVGSTDEEQARWLVRSFFLFAGMGVEKAFVFFFNDDDAPQLHAASGLTRKFQPKPAYHAVAWMLRSLENHRFHRVLKASKEEGYIYEFTPEKPGHPIIWAAWHPTRDTTIKIETSGLRPTRAELMPLDPSPPQAAEFAQPEDHLLQLNIGEKPVLVWLEQP